ncbi:MAG TPA: hypothetical protein PK335_02665 [Draconibacterium sp.]|nr:hypothetical protein [Draconibacterium sp.]
MKNINKILTLIILVGLGVTACTYEIDDPAGARNVIEATPVIENLNPSIYLAADKANTYVAFDVTAGEGGQSMDAILEVSYNGGQQRAQLGSFTIPATGVEVTLADVAAAIGLSTDNMQGGAYVNIEVLTKSGDKYYRSAAAVNPLIACDYIAADYVGTPNASSAGWGVNGPVTVTVDPNNEYTLLVTGMETIDGLNEDQGPLPLVIDPASYAITVPKTVLASDAWGYHNIAYAGTGTLNTCSRAIQLNIAISVDEGSFGEYTFDITY